MTDRENRTDTPRGADLKYFAVVGVLLLMIIASLCALWLKERSNANQLAGRVRQLRSRRLSQAQLRQMVSSRLAAARSGGVQPIRREDVYKAPATLDGEKVQVLHISPDAGRRLGFRPGDVIHVGREAAETAPATQESPADDPMNR